MVKSCLFSIAVNLARRNSFALALAVLGSINKNLTLFKKTIIDLSKYLVGDDIFPIEFAPISPFYLVQVWCGRGSQTCNNNPC